jgi:putative ABC transport system substrate-binding protein
VPNLHETAQLHRTARRRGGGVPISTRAQQQAMPVIGFYYRRYFVTRGGLLSYDYDLIDMNRRAAQYVDRILKGEKPADLPVQAPTKFDLVINLKTAKTLGLESLTSCWH